MSLLVVGVITTDSAPASPLASAARRHPDIDALDLTLDDAVPETVAGLVLDLPVAERAAALARLGSRRPVPVLIEAPVAIDLKQADSTSKLIAGMPVLALNPLRWWLPLRRLADEVSRDGDPVETIYAAWRFRADQPWGHALPQLVDYVNHLVGSRPGRISAMSRRQPDVLLATLRYQNDVVVSLELGQHLPASSPLPSTFLLECFCRDRVYHCQPDRQAISVVGATPAVHDWSASPATLMVEEFVRTLRQPQPLAATEGIDLDPHAIGQEILAAAEQNLSQR